MADVTIKCSKCGQQLTVSEFVDIASLKCRACGNQLSLGKHQSTVSQKKAFGIRYVRPQQVESEDGGQTPAGKKRPNFKPPKRASLVVRIANFEVSGYTLSWFLFFIMSGVLVYLRFGGVFKDEVALEDCKLYGMTGFGILYAVVILDACRDEIFEGLLAFFVPPYAIYYLFVKSDSFFLRAMLCAFAAGFGYDVYLILMDVMTEFFRSGSDWIRQDGYE